MPVSAATLRLLMDAGLQGDALLGVVASIDADCQPAPRSSNAERQARFRQRKRETVTDNVTSNVTESVTEALRFRARVEGSSSREENTGQKKLVPTPRNELEAVLSPEIAQAVIDHRQRIGRPLTAHAANLLARKFAKCPDPHLAADAMIANGWQGFEVEWMENRTGNRGPPGNGTSKPIPPAQAAVDALERLKTGKPANPSPDFGTGTAIEISDYRRVV